MAFPSDAEIFARLWFDMVTILNESRSGTLKSYSITHCTHEIFMLDGSVEF